MLLPIPAFTAVYTRNTSTERSFHFSHLSSTDYLHQVPATLSVSDLRQHSVDLHNTPPGRGYADLPLLVFITAETSMTILTLRNWANTVHRSEPYCRHHFPPISCPTPADQFPDARCSETTSGYSMIPFFAALCSYTSTTRRHAWAFEGARFISASHVVAPPTLFPSRRVASYVNQCRRALARATRTHAWLVGRYSYREAHPVPRGCRHDHCSNEDDAA